MYVIVTLVYMLQNEQLEFQKEFFKFDEDFEYGAELPHIFVR